MNDEKEECQDYIDLLKLKEQVESNREKVIKDRVDCFLKNKEYFRKMEPEERLSAILCSYSKDIRHDYYDGTRHLYPEYKHARGLLEICKACFPDFKIDYKDDFTSSPIISMKRLDMIRFEELRKRREELTQEQRQIDEELEKFVK